MVDIIPKQIKSYVIQIAVPVAFLLHGVGFYANIKPL